MKTTVEFHPTVVIGLGGTGHGVLLKLKNRFESEFGKVPSIVKFLSIDTTQDPERSETTADGRKVELEQNDERYLVQVEDPGTLLGPNNPHIYTWWTQGSTVSSIISGAQQIRPRGRLALFANYAEIKDRLAQKMDEVRKVENIALMTDDGFYVSDRRVVQVYIVSSLAGGTGSGMFLDVAFIVRNLVPISNVYGTFILPRVFNRYPGTDLIKANTYAALKEIESFSKLKDTDTKIIYYGIDTIRVKRPPFDLVYIIDSMNERERIIDDVKTLHSRVADGLYLLVGSEIGTGNSNAIDNIKSHLASAGAINTHSASYCSFGVASCRWKAEEYIREYEKKQFASAQTLIEQILQNTDAGDHAEAEAEKFIQRRHLGIEQITDLVGDLNRQQGSPSVKSHGIDIAPWTFNKDSGNDLRSKHNEHVERKSREFKDRVAHNLLQLTETFRNDLKAWQQENQSRPDFLAYTERFATTLGKRLQQLGDALKQRLSKAERDSGGIEFTTHGTALDKAASPFLGFGLSKKMRAACIGYNGMIDRQCRNILLKEQLQQAIELAKALRESADEIARTCVSTRKKMREILDNLAVKHERLSVKYDQKNPFEYILQYMPDLPELEIRPAAFVNWCKERYGSLHSFMHKKNEEIEKGIMEFINADGVKLSELSIDLILKEVKEKAERMKKERTNDGGTDEHLSDDQNELEFQHLKDILAQLSRLAAPLWRYNDSEIPLNHKSINTKLSYCGVPATEKPAAEDYRGSWLNGVNTKFIKTIDQHRMTFFNITFGVPLFALQGIKEMEQEYYSKRDTRPCHLNFRWTTYPDLVPKQIESVKGCFALALAPMFNLIRRGGDQIYTVHLDERRISLGKGMKEAYATFEGKPNIYSDVNDKILQLMDGEDLLKLKQKLQTYVDRLSEVVSLNGSKKDGANNGSEGKSEVKHAPLDGEYPQPDSGEDKEFLNEMVETIKNFIRGISSH